MSKPLLFCSSTDTQRNSCQGSIIDKLFTISSKTNEKKISFCLKHLIIFRTSFSDFLFLIPMTLPKIPRYMQSKKPTLKICQHFLYLHIIYHLFTPDVYNRLDAISLSNPNEDLHAAPLTPSSRGGIFLKIAYV